MTHSDPIERRASQIHGWLMRMRRRRERGIDCFIIFDEEPPAAKRKRRLPPGMMIADGGAPPASPEPAHWTKKKVPDSFHHFVQFGFEEADFCIDLPVETLSATDAERLLAERDGFKWLSEVRPDIEASRTHNPLVKAYAYGHEPVAVDDMLFLLLDVWNIPADFCWYVKAARFGGRGKWEWGVPLA